MTVSPSSWGKRNSLAVVFLEEHSLSVVLLVSSMVTSFCSNGCVLVRASLALTGELVAALLVQILNPVVAYV